MRHFTVSSYQEASNVIEAALNDDVPVTLTNPRGLHHSAGLLYIKTMFEAAALEYPHANVTLVFDADEDAATAITALAAGFRAIRFHGAPEVATKLADIAKNYGASLVSANDDNA